MVSLDLLFLLDIGHVVYILCEDIVDFGQPLHRIQAMSPTLMQQRVVRSRGMMNQVEIYRRGYNIILNINLHFIHQGIAGNGIKGRESQVVFGSGEPVRSGDL